MAWIEQNILLSLDSVPFDKSDATLAPEAGSCAECPKRTGFNTLLFGEMSKRDRCSDAACFNQKIRHFVEKRIAEKPKLGADRNRLRNTRRQHGAATEPLRRAATGKTREAKQPLSIQQMPCKHMADAIVVEGAERGHTVKVCAQPDCEVHFADRTNKAPSPEQLARERQLRRRELEKRKLEMTTRHRTLAEVLKKVASPLDRADLVLVANTLLEKTEPLRREALARRHKMVEGSASEVTYPDVQKGIARLLRQLDEGGLSKLIVEIALLGSVESASQQESDVLMATAKRHGVDPAKLRKVVEAEFAAKQAKAVSKQKQTTKKITAKKSA